MSDYTITITPPRPYDFGKDSHFTLSNKDLTNLVNAYDPVSDPAPIVINTPKLDDPAYGWVSGLALQGGKIVAKLEKLSKEFAESAKKGGFNGVSAAFYWPENPANPKPGFWYLKHISFKGKHPALDNTKAYGTVSYALASPGQTLSLTSDFLQSGEEDASFKCPNGYTVDPEDMAIFARAKALQARNPNLTIIEAAQHVKQTSQASFTEMEEKLTSTSQFIVPDIHLPKGMHINPSQADLYHRAKALMLDNPSLDIVSAAALVEAS